jgi:hypothetical protein
LTGRRERAAAEKPDTRAWLRRTQHLSIAENSPLRQIGLIFEFLIRKGRGEDAVTKKCFKNGIILHENGKKDVFLG